MKKYRLFLICPESTPLQFEPLINWIGKKAFILDHSGIQFDAHHGEVLKIETEIDEKDFYPELKLLAEKHSCDSILMPEDYYLQQNRQGLAVFDMDSTLISCECIDELAGLQGVKDKVASVTAAAMRGELDFNQSFTERVGCLKGLSEDKFLHFAANLPLMPGAEELALSLNKNKWYTAVFSGGFTHCAGKLIERLGMHESAANELEIHSGELTGRHLGEIVNGEVKKQKLTELKKKMPQAEKLVIAVGDGANDLLMLAEAEHGFAAHAKPLVRAQARHCISFCDLRALIPVLSL